MARLVEQLVGDERGFGFEVLPGGRRLAVARPVRRQQCPAFGERALRPPGLPAAEHAAVHQHHAWSLPPSVNVQSHDR